MLGLKCFTFNSFCFLGNFNKVKLRYYLFPSKLFDTIIIFLGNMFGAIGSVKRIRNPIEVASMLAEDSTNYSSGLVPPSVLVSEGAEKYAESKGVLLCSNSDLITSEATSQWQKARAKVGIGKENRLDTVGAVSVSFIIFLYTFKGSLPLLAEVDLKGREREGGG